MTDAIEEKLRNAYREWLEGLTKKELIEAVINLDPTGLKDGEYEDYRNSL